MQTYQRAIERSILNIKRRDRKLNTDIRKTSVIDALEYCKKLKWKWTGRAARTNKNKWSNKVTKWTGPINKRNKGRPKERWTDEINRVAGKEWTAKAKDKDTWRNIEEAFARAEVHNR
ncbi:hypothetical protein EVAR_116_1 [Eumeta japonica]|uniref:Endonuclease-reverse transcriptase n=1 Tax=Eumeta variegata TaxID=151549 RepID=A0A4C1S9D7_EUMVA|nr:hypothetical protein EVAR_116_1 [Eumeta japonica]